ncbi:uncharacterized protein LOC129290886 [Prosopis cineraria]|uniref:uncharacterized protein LOC129290886 n=1 Tax=Prosopis cineraria TaxID=364024 RepID=UPI00240EC403|nr:uncharacterized protein LOC129290886 [Prosopis cineraria]
MGFKFEIVYKPGKENRAADTLSRQDESLELMGFSLWQYDDVEEWEREVLADLKLSKILQQLITDKEGVEGYSVIHGCLHYKERLVLPKESTRIPLLLKEYHDSPMGGHSGYLRTYKRLSNELFKQASTQLCLSSSYHLESDGQTEVLNRSLETYLRCFANEKPSQWAKWLSWAEYWYNTSYHGAAGMTPFKAVYGRDSPAFLKLSGEPSAIEDVNEQIQAWNQIISLLRDNLAKAQSKMKEQANKHRRDVQFNVGDFVYVKLRPYRLKMLAKRVNEKLSPRFYGPFKVLAKVGNVAYKLELPPTARIHLVFHVSQLKQSVPSIVVNPTIPPALTSELELQVQPEDIRRVRRLMNGQQEVLVKWHDLPEFENSWEGAGLICKQFPAFPLEDKVKL